MSFTTYKLPYNPDYYVDWHYDRATQAVLSTNLNLGAGWSFIDLDNSDNQKSFLAVYSYADSIKELLDILAPLEITIPEIMSIFYKVKKFKITTSLPALWLYPDENDIGQTTKTTIITTGLGNLEGKFDNIYQYICGPASHQYPEIWLGRQTFGHYTPNDFNLMRLDIQPLFYIYKKKYYITINYIQSFSIKATEEGEDDNDGQVSFYPGKNSWTDKVKCGNLTILNKQIPLYNLYPREGKPPIECNVTVAPEEEWTLD